MTARLAWIVAPLVLAGLHGCAPRGGQSEGNSTPVPEVPAVTRVAITGTVSYRERMALPPDAVLEAWMTDITPGIIVTQQLLAEARVPVDGRQVPIPFEMTFDPAIIAEDHDYGVRAVLRTADGTPLFESAEPVRVLTKGNPSHAELLLVRAGGEP